MTKRNGKVNSASKSPLVKEAEVFYDSKGRGKKVMLPYKTYVELITLAEDAEDHKLMDEVKNEPAIPWNEAKKKLKLK